MPEVKHQKWWGWGYPGIPEFRYDNKPKFAPFVRRHIGLDLDTAEVAPPPDFAAAFVTADTLADLNGVVKHTLEVSKVSFAPIDAAVEATGMESGGMSPIGLPSDWPLLVDQHILSIPKLYLGSGVRPSKLVVDGSIFADIPGVQFVSALGKPRG